MQITVLGKVSKTIDDWGENTILFQMVLIVPEQVRE
jgi:hypothetical protein